MAAWAGEAAASASNLRTLRLAVRVFLGRAQRDNEAAFERARTNRLCVLPREGGLYDPHCIIDRSLGRQCSQDEVSDYEDDEEESDEAREDAE